MEPEFECLVNVSLCEEFDYMTWKCLVCPTNTVYHESGFYCVPSVTNCISYGINGCALCEKNYVISNGACIILDYVETMDNGGNYEKVCLNRNTY